MLTSVYYETINCLWTAQLSFFIQNAQLRSFIHLQAFANGHFVILRRLDLRRRVTANRAAERRSFSPLLEERLSRRAIAAAAPAIEGIRQQRLKQL